jgi:hypothetical protein
VTATLADELDIKARLNLAPADALPERYTNWAGPAKEASVVVEGYLHRTWSALNDVPEAVRVVTSRMTVRAMQAPAPGPAGVPVDGQRSFSSTFGPMSHQRTFGEDAVFSTPWLSKADKAALAPYILRGGVFNEPMYPERLVDRTGYDFEPGWSSP